MIKELLKQCEDVALNPKDVIGKYKEDRKVIAMAPLYGPEELVYAAGMLPVGIWGSYKVEIDLAKQYFPAFCASVIMADMELALNGTYEKYIDAVIIPGMSDTLNSFGQNWKSGVKNIPFISIVYPQNRKIECGVKFLTAELEDVKKKLEEIAGKEITEEALAEAIDLYNAHRKAMRDFSELAASHPNTVDNRGRAFVYKSAHFMDKKDHLEIVEKINEELKNLPEEEFAGKRVVTTGLILDDESTLQALEDNNLRIVGDLVAHESIQYNTDVPADGENALERIANQWRDIEGFTAAYDPKKLRGIMVGELAKERKADGVIFALLKFSDFEEYDMPICLRDIRDAGFPVVEFDVDQQDNSSEQVKTRVQSFSEML
ncbi:2-hydroxyacyl-CoA dehydratase family protein [Peptoniphilus sp. KCTC 25270]|uniref:2-hydroxyacyl-CoA dehydratase subunit D n=1 Tax=Peptoniphilus sp. KCTC 25270 TaxID=2897414 RepID=UPI001E520EF5|nr:2-hydroxyacyl-CoA dehydratase family protein [Peptoniphilus sp. KCTC 25270]MCD1147434.1 2-hydroxyacyl-CoA dehydratase family protein [Peptoniphilus sp. KCTC 25270]